MCDRHGRTFGLPARFHETIGDDGLDRTTHCIGIRGRTIGVRPGRAAGFRHAPGLHLAAVGCRLTGCARGVTIGPPRPAGHRRVGRGRGHDIGTDRIAVSPRRSRLRRRRDVGRRLDRTGSGARRRESVQRRLPGGVLAVRNGGHRLGVRHRVITRDGRRTRSRLAHRIAEQVERVFVPRRIAARVAGPRGCLGGGVCRGRDGTRARTGR
ncbi:hypothetical protein [Burkholderia sp. USMB20]|uniref:hypothetical protein n=1 Tax=Burkholderia sp. USMB20 TaxID=1571773 RepID=UPI002E268F32